jgi:hypothetical protein
MNKDEIPSQPPHPICASPRQDKQWVMVCATCKGSLRKNKLPVDSVNNGLDFGKIPDCLKDLTYFEQKAISLYNCYTHICHIGGWQQWAQTGGEMPIKVNTKGVIDWANRERPFYVSSVSYMKNNSSVKAMKMPRSPKDCDIVLVRCQGLCICIYSYEVNPKKIKAALDWLCKHHPSYWRYTRGFENSTSDTTCIISEENIQAWVEPQEKINFHNDPQIFSNLSLDVVTSQDILLHPILEEEDVTELQLYHSDDNTLDYTQTDPTQDNIEIPLDCCVDESCYKLGEPELGEDDNIYKIKHTLVDVGDQNGDHMKEICSELNIQNFNKTPVEDFPENEGPDNPFEIVDFWEATYPHLFPYGHGGPNTQNRCGVVMLF